MYRIGIDLGGTAIKGGIIDDAAMEVMASDSVATPSVRNDALTLQAIAAAISRMIFRLNAVIENEYKAEKAASVGIGVPASISGNMVIDANNLCLVNADLAGQVSLRTGLEVRLINDAHAAGLGEYSAGAGKGCREFFMMTLGTGVGGCYIRSGEVIKGCNDAAGEVGHMAVAAGGRECTCGRRGCLEAYASASALIRDAQAVDPSIENGRQFFKALEGGSPALRKVFDDYLDILACGVTNVINILQPDVLVIGGGISAVGSTLLDPLAERVASMVYTRHSEKQTKIRAALLQNDAGLIGAAMFAAV